MSMTKKQRREHKAMIKARKTAILKHRDTKGRRSLGFWLGGVPQG